MNPLLLLLPIAAYLYLSSKEKADKETADKETADKGKGGGGTGPTVPEFKRTNANYTDSRGILWEVWNWAPDSWTGAATGPLKRYFGERLEAKTRSDLIKKIEKATKEQAKEVGKEKAEDLKNAVAAGIKDAIASAKAYEDSLFGFQVEYVDDNFDEDESSNWQRTYNDALNDKLQRLGYTIDQDGYVKKY